MSSCATQNSKEEYKGKPDKANAKIATQKKTAFVIRTGFQATDKNSRLIREWETFLSRLRVAKQLVAGKLVHKGEEWQFSTTSFMSMIQFPLSLFGVWVWSSNFCPHHAVSCSFWEPSASNSMNPSWIDHQTTALDIETPSTSVHLSVREDLEDTKASRDWHAWGRGLCRGRVDWRLLWLSLP